MGTIKRRADLPHLTSLFTSYVGKADIAEALFDACVFFHDAGCDDVEATTAVPSRFIR